MGTRINIQNHDHEWRLFKMDKKHRKCGMPRRKVWQCTYIGCSERKYQIVKCPCQLKGKKNG